jgi:hypothetical protein
MRANGIEHVSHEEAYQPAGARRSPRIPMPSFIAPRIFKARLEAAGL